MSDNTMEQQIMEINTFIYTVDSSGYISDGIISCEFEDDIDLEIREKIERCLIKNKTELESH